uniref:Uncharacterized protein n=1 Tax=Arundo donax TaxID=35708 RepID=A0A0A8ZMU8_ARUDO
MKLLCLIIPNSPYEITIFDHTKYKCKGGSLVGV